MAPSPGLKPGSSTSNRVTGRQATAPTTELHQRRNSSIQCNSCTFNRIECWVTCALAMCSLWCVGVDPWLELVRSIFTLQHAGMLYPCGFGRLWCMDTSTCLLANDWGVDLEFECDSIFLYSNREFDSLPKQTKHVLLGRMCLIAESYTSHVTSRLHTKV